MFGDHGGKVCDPDFAVPVAQTMSFGFETFCFCLIMLLELDFYALFVIFSNYCSIVHDSKAKLEWGVFVFSADGGTVCDPDVAVPVAQHHVVWFVGLVGST